MYIHTHSLKKKRRQWINDLGNIGNSLVLCISLPFLRLFGLNEKGSLINGFLFYAQVTGDNVHSLALCDFDGDGKTEVCSGAE